MSKKPNNTAPHGEEIDLGKRPTKRLRRGRPPRPDGPMAIFSTRIPQALARDFRELARSSDTSTSALLRTLVEQAVSSLK
jgi:hypothetical protein